MRALSPQARMRVEIGTVLLAAILPLVLLFSWSAVEAQETEASATRAAGRICTSDDYTCSVQMSQLRFAPERVTNVYLGVAGDPALDAFSRTDGPLLLVHSTGAPIPYVVYEEIVRLNPRGVIAVGPVHDDVLHEATLPPDQLKAKWDREYAASRAAQPTSAGRTGIAAKVAACESGVRKDDGTAVPGTYDYNAKNPTSSASGAYQFVNRTWEATTGKPAPARAYPPSVQDAAFWKAWNGGSGSFHWSASRSCWSRM